MPKVWFQAACYGNRREEAGYGWRFSNDPASTQSSRCWSRTFAAWNCCCPRVNACLWTCFWPEIFSSYCPSNQRLWWCFQSSFSCCIVGCSGTCNWGILCCFLRMISSLCRGPNSRSRLVGSLYFFALLDDLINLYFSFMWVDRDITFDVMSEKFIEFTICFFRLLTLLL